MKWQIKKDNEIKFQTDQDKCLPDKTILKEMIKGGYKIYCSGKIYNPSAKSVKTKK
jgi:hypothetical protein